MCVDDLERNKMPKATWTLTVRSTFCAAHALRHYCGKCERLHGHNYGLAVEIEGTQLLPDVEIVMDFTELKAIIKEAIAPFDHINLNEVPPFDRINPSSENLARYIWKLLEPRMPKDIMLASVTVSEKPEQSATYRERR